MDSVNSLESLFTVQCKNTSFYKEIEMVCVTAFLRSMELLFNLKTGYFYYVI